MAALKPAPTVEQTLQIDACDLADEQKYRERAEFCWQQAQDATDSSGPKWAAESAKYERLARAVRDKINEIQHDRDLMDHERAMTTLGRRG